MNVLAFALVCLGGAFGSGLRYAASLAAKRMWPTSTLPIGTLAVNILGSAAFGALIFLAHDTKRLSPNVQAALLTGVLGGLTTFSSFCGESVALLRAGAWGSALAYVGGSVIVGIAAAAAAYHGVRLLSS